MQRRVSGLQRELEIIVERAAEAGVDAAAAGRPEWTADVARLHAYADDLLERVRANRR